MDSWVDGEGGEARLVEYGWETMTSAAPLGLGRLGSGVVIARKFITSNC